MDKKSAIERVKEFAELVKKQFSVITIILYGSYAQGTAREDSDIDVAIVVDTIKEDFYTSEVALFKLRREVDVRIEPVLFINNNDRSGFLETILQTGEIIYQSEQP